jgi:hypothetical protein
MLAFSSPLPGEEHFSYRSDFDMICEARIIIRRSYRKGEIGEIQVDVQNGFGRAGSRSVGI